jgi:hypothetical protein
MLPIVKFYLLFTLYSIILFLISIFILNILKYICIPIIETPYIIIKSIIKSIIRLDHPLLDVVLVLTFMWYLIKNDVVKSIEDY